MAIESPDVGFIGLGAMGSRMATRLQRAGCRLALFDTDQAALERFSSDEVVICRSPRDVANLAPVVMTSLPTGEIVYDVACGSDGLKGGAALRTYIDFSTTGRDQAERVADELGAAGVQYLDCPVSGGAAGAEEGTLTIIAAGSDDVLEAVRPLLNVLSARIVRVGDAAGQAQTVKVANNLLSATAIAATTEVLLLGMKAGIRPSAMLEVFNASSGQNTATSDKFPKHVLTRRFAANFNIGLMTKDVHLCLDEAADQEVPMALGNIVGDLWSTACSALPADADITAFVTMLEDRIGTTIGEPSTTIA